MTSEQDLRRRIVSCTRCPRLVEYRRTIKQKAAFASQNYWRKPVPGFGDINARVLVLGLAPASHGGLRTGRIFTGDASSRFLVRALYAAGFASQPTSESTDDGLVYTDCDLTAAVKCAPPGDKPTREEVSNCSVYLDEEMALLRNLQAVLALGSLAFRAYVDHLRKAGVDVGHPRFSHGAVYDLGNRPALYTSYHPSPRNTNTGVLTPKMLSDVLERVKSDLHLSSSKHN